MTTTGPAANSALAEDLLEGAASIAEFMFGDRRRRRKVYYLADDARGPDKMPCFRVGELVCARKSTLLRWIAEREKAA